MRTLTLATLLVAFQTPAQAQPFCQPGTQAQADQAELTAAGCVRDEALRLEPSREAASDIATAAMVGCSSKVSIATMLVHVCLGDTSSSLTRNDIEMLIRNGGVYAVVELRAKRASTISK